MNVKNDQALRLEDLTTSSQVELHRWPSVYRVTEGEGADVD